MSDLPAPPPVTPTPPGVGASVPHDLFLSGTVFFDIVFTGLGSMPAAGTEVMADGLGQSPGGIANLAIAAARLGLRTSLAAAFGDDVYGDFCWSTLAHGEGVDLSASRRFPDWHSPTTVSLAVARDRSMVTHAHPPPMSTSELLGGTTPAATIGFSHLTPDADGTPEPWVEDARAAGMRLFADVGWDADERWSSAVLDGLAGYHGFLPNSVEAMAYTHTDDPHDALHRLAEQVPVVVVTCGGQGALAIDGTTGEEEWAPSLPVNEWDPTGAGDVFAAGFVLGTVRGWPLRHRLAFANLVAALSVQQVGGSLAAPGWGDIADWLHVTQAHAARGSGAAVDQLQRLGFLTDVLPDDRALRAVRRASATIARASDA